MGEKLDPEVQAVLDRMMKRRGGKSPHGATAADVETAKAVVARQKAGATPPPAAGGESGAEESKAKRGKRAYLP